MMPFPLTFLVEKNCACPTYQTDPWCNEDYL
jgi:hypothetical protein